MQKRKFEKAYENDHFLRSSDARIIRIISEYLEPKQRLHREKVRDTIVFFGSARSIPVLEAQNMLNKLAKKNGGNQNTQEFRKAKKKLLLAKYYEDARELARRLTEWSHSLDHGSRFIICSGGGPGMMEAANRGAAEAGGKSIGFNISIPMEQDSNSYITPELNFDFHYFFMRKFWFVYLSKALVIFPGGFGTMDEMFEVLTLVQTKKLHKEISVVIYGREYWESIINFQKFVEWGTISEEDLKLIQIADSVDEAFSMLTGYLQEKILNREKFWSL
ncbi:TIGR00730 family Rossman fold protein [candidate division KSB1 bacterium]|nr:TIGR00730 family Rossman fold protein [candidate division KSB1 bacterium]